MDGIIEFDLIKNQASNIIKVIGVGGGGGNAVRNMYSQGIKDVSFAICNTDSQALSRSNIPTKIQLGDTGLGAGGNPEKGRAAAEASIEQIRALFNDTTQMVFITAGMGGGTGTGAAPIIAHIAKEMGILTIGIVTIPFQFEMKPKIVKAIKGVNEMKENVDALLVINNERLREIYADGITTAKEAFCKADDILTTATKSIAEIITIEGTINRDFCDVETIMKDGGSAIMAMGRAKGKYRIQNAILDALNSPLLNDNDIEKAQKLLYIIYSSKENPILINELSELNTFMEELDPNIEVIWGLYDDDSLGEDVKITLIATGFDSKKDFASDTSDDTRLKSEIEKYYKSNPKPLDKQPQSIVAESNNDTKEETTETQEPITFEETKSHSTKEKLITRLSNMISKLMEEE
ncbi:MULTISPECIES: cell division protein FtsZ [Bacteroides]|uniref:cell division protein FtsZ n=1 Tax=Bacteroides TaxID=816 RepID=UPI00216562C5|nr:cell division protein FtsZ [Bacteroides thetaiotaomicron]MCS2204829.1 cell division protein FtsZ [Bacteroides thetaiotaomicron]MCS2782837.1 cell division protein FtsZ [Bacteroides thetaiotaomicron]